MSQLWQRLAKAQPGSGTGPLVGCLPEPGPLRSESSLAHPCPCLASHSQALSFPAPLPHLGYPKATPMLDAWWRKGQDKREEASVPGLSSKLILRFSLPHFSLPFHSCLSFLLPHLSQLLLLFLLSSSTRFSKQTHTSSAHPSPACLGLSPKVVAPRFQFLLLGPGIRMEIGRG